jgi:hypothetical protein
MGRLAGLGEGERWVMGERARATAAEWGPARFGRGLLEALELARAPREAVAAHE